MPEDSYSVAAGLVAELARHDVLSSQLIADAAQKAGFNLLSRKRQAKALLQLGIEHKIHGRFGRLRSAILVGVTLLQQEFLTNAERDGLFLSDGVPLGKFGDFLRGLILETGHLTDESWNILAKRLTTYSTYHELAAIVSQLRSAAIPRLKTHPRHDLKKIIALTNLFFLHSHLAFEVPRHLIPLFSELGEPEELSSIASLLIAEANHWRALDSLDLGLPVVTGLLDQNVLHLIAYGQAAVELSEVGKHISLYGYVFDRSAVGGRPVFYLKPPLPEFEYALRLGYVRSEMGIRYAYRGNEPDAVTAISVAEFAEAIAHRFREEFSDIRAAGTDARRMRLRIPFPIPERIADFLGEGRFYDDLVEEDVLGQDFIFPLRRDTDPEIQLTDKLDLKTFSRIWRVLRFLAFLDIALLRPHSRTDPYLFLNSLVRIGREDALVEMVSSLGISREQGQEFLRLVTADVRHLGYFDFQYRPFLRMMRGRIPPPAKIEGPQEILHASALVAGANIMRNVQAANKIRLTLNAGIFVEAVAGLMASRFRRVTTNRRIAGEGRNTDIDVVVFEGARVYLFECKHSIPPTGPHEMRDIWEDIEKGVKQLRVAIETFGDPKAALSYLTGWFPGTKQKDCENLRLVPCVLCSNRIFSGLTHDGIPIRDYASLARLIDDGTVAMGGQDETGRVVMFRYRLWRDPTGFNAADLDDYLGAESRYFKMFAPFMHPCTRFKRIGNSTVARGTYNYGVEVGMWRAHLESLGCEFVGAEEPPVRDASWLQGFLERREKGGEIG